MSGPGALLLVRAVVPDPADRAAFDRRRRDRMTRRREPVGLVRALDRGS